MNCTYYTVGCNKGTLTFDCVDDILSHLPPEEVWCIRKTYTAPIGEISITLFDKLYPYPSSDYFEYYSSHEEKFGANALTKKDIDMITLFSLRA
jgi:hypothetical protein